MNRTNARLTAIVCISIAATQAVYIAVPLQHTMLYDLAVRAAVYILLAVMVAALIGKDPRPALKAYESNMAALLSVVAFGIVILVVSFLFGAGLNAQTAHPFVIMRNLWSVGVVVAAGEYIRFKLIRSASFRTRDAVVTALTLVLALGQMNALHSLVHGSPMVWSVFFEFIFPPLVISTTASYFAVKGGSPLSLIVIGAVYGMAAFLLPILPNIVPIAFALIICGVVFLTALAFHFISGDNRKILRRQEKRAAKYVKKSPVGYATAAIIITAAIAFFRGAFPIYPIIVLTDSMSGTIERGSIVFVERVMPGDAYTQVGEGYVIHFESDLGVGYIHRVVDFAFDAQGNRTYITRGDAAELTDPHPLPQENVLGIARTFLPYAGWPYIVARAVIRSF